MARSCRATGGRARSPRRHPRHLHARLPVAGLAVAVRGGDDPVGREIPVLSAGAISRVVTCTRRMAVVVAERVCRLAADFRSAVARVRAALRAAGRLRCRGQPARLRRRDLRLSVPRRGRDHPVVPRPRLACGRRARGRDGIRARRLGQCAHSAHRSDRQPGLPAPCTLARGARARALVVARGPGGRRGRRTDGDRTRPGRIARAARSIPCTCCNSLLPISSARWTRTSNTGRRKA